MPRHLSRSPSVRSLLLVALGAVGMGVVACARSDASQQASSDTGEQVDTAAVVTDSAPPVAPADTTANGLRRRAPLTPLEDSIAQKLTFVPNTRGWFLAAGRRKRLLLDVGRVDIEVRRDPARLAAFKRVVRDRMPVRPGTKLHLSGPWGSGEATFDSVDTWNGRIVAVLEAGPLVDSIAKAVDPLVAVAMRADSARPATTDSCVRILPDSTRIKRGLAFGDSVVTAMRTTEVPPYERLLPSVRWRSAQVTGCFGTAQQIVIATLWAGNYEWVRERVFLLAEGAAPVQLRVADLRCKAHEVLGAFDADGDGIDDIATRGLTELSGATVVLKLAPDKKRLDRLAAGFAWESR